MTGWFPVTLPVHQRLIQLRGSISRAFGVKPNTREHTHSCEVSYWEPRCYARYFTSNMLKFIEKYGIIESTYPIYMEINISSRLFAHSQSVIIIRGTELLPNGYR